jgi:hypothetical protein
VVSYHHKIWRISFRRKERFGQIEDIIITLKEVLSQRNVAVTTAVFSRRTLSKNKVAGDGIAWGDEDTQTQKKINNHCDQVNLATINHYQKQYKF